MNSYINKPRSDLDALIKLGKVLLLKLQPGVAQAQKSVPGDFSDGYQVWYSEAQAIIGELLPGRLDDFNQYYAGKPNRKSVSKEAYGIRDVLRGVFIYNYRDSLIVPESLVAASMLMRQQVSILESLSKKFESSLFNVRHLLAADLLDSQLDAARELLKAGYLRAAGLLAGLAIESHLKDVVQKRKIAFNKKPAIANLNEALHTGGFIEVDVFRKIQHLNDLRNKCVHRKGSDPTDENVEELINGAGSVIKTVFA